MALLHVWTNDGVRIRVAAVRRDRERIFAQETKKGETQIGTNRENPHETACEIHEAFMVDKNVRLTESIEAEVIPDDYRMVSTNSIA
jgi:hypothetical protein